MKKLSIIISSLLFAFVADGQGFLKAKGKQVVNEKGETVILRGMGLGGWLLQEGYMFKLSNLGQQYRIKQKIEEVVGKEKTARFYDDWITHHTTKADIDSMAAWGFNSMRLPMHYALYTLPVEEERVAGENTWIEKGFAITDSLLQWCKSNKIYLILDLHAAPGGQGNDLPISDRDASKPSLWESKANQQKTVALWKQLATRYANEPWIGGYDIINEPNWGFEDAKDFRGTSEQKNEPLRALMIEITKAIREVDKKHLIIIEGNGFGNNYRGIFPSWDDNMMISFHKYGNFNNSGAIKNFLELRDTHNMPIWLGESGENSNTWFTEAIHLAESNGIGWAWWQEKKMNINNPLEIKQPEGYANLLSYWSGKGPKPTEEEAWRTLQQLLHNISIRNNIFHRDVVDAMFRQVQSTATVPFKEMVLNNQLTIAAVDFDMGRQRYAYYDRDSASYQYTPGVNTRGNKGHSYRNDGVDIESGKGAPYVFSIEDGEWLQYSIEVKKEGSYNVSFTTAAADSSGAFSLYVNDRLVVEKVTAPVTGAANTWQTSKTTTISLKKGINTLRFYADKGGFNFSGIQLSKK